MEWDEFWERLEHPGPSAPDVAAHADALVQSLVEDGVEAVVGFGHRFEEALDALDTWDLWGVAYLLLGGLSDDGFEYFRCWVVGEGHHAWERAQADPEGYLVELIEQAERAEEDPWDELSEREVGDGEPLLYVGGRAHEQLTGQWLPPHPERLVGKGPFAGDRPWGEEWDEDDLAARFPRLAGLLPDLPTDPVRFAVGDEIVPVARDDLDDLPQRFDMIQKAITGADAALARGDHPAAMEQVRAVLDDDATWPLVGSFFGAEVARTLAYQGGVSRLQCGDPDGAARWLGLVADQLDEAPHVRRALAQIHLSRADLDAAEELLDTDEGAPAFDLALGALVAGYRGDHAGVVEGARRTLAAIETDRVEQHPWDLAGVNVLVGQALVEVGEVGAAVDCAREVAELTANAPPDLPLVPQGLTLAAAVARLEGDFEGARRSLDQVWGRVAADTDDRGTAEREMARCLRGEGDEAGAQDWYARAAATFGRAGHRLLADATVREATTPD